MRPYMEKLTREIFTSYRDESYDFPSHFHPNLELVFCFSGQQTLHIGEETVLLKTGDACVIFPNTAHEYQAVPHAGDTRVLAIICSASLLSGTFPDILSMRPENPHLPAASLPDEIPHLFRGILHTKDNLKQIGYTYLILSDFLNLLKLTPSPGDLSLPSVICSYIDTNFQEPLTIEYLAKKFGYHPSYIANLFCYRLKIPFRTYLGLVRCDYAATQIRTTGKSLTEIAYESGFGSLNTFCRVFKKTFSMTPSQYRKNHG